MSKQTTLSFYKSLQASGKQEDEGYDKICVIIRGTITGDMVRMITRAREKDLDEHSTF